MAVREVRVVPSEHTPSQAVEAIRAWLASQWSDIVWKFESASAEHEVYSEPTLAIVARGDDPPRADPAEIGVVYWSTGHHGDQEHVPRNVRGALRAQLARVLAPRDGAAPGRKLAGPPAEVTRAALFRLPRLLPQVLEPVPRVMPKRCLHSIGCTECADSCPSGALQFPDGRPVIEDAACTACGACVAACPTGALHSGTIGDQQWEALLQELAREDEPPALRVSCLKDVGRFDFDGVVLTVPCVGEMGWYPLWLMAAHGLKVDVVCADGACPLTSAGQAAIERWQRVKKLIGEREVGTGVTASDLRLESNVRWGNTVVAIRAAQGTGGLVAEASPGSPTLGCGIGLESSPGHECTLCESCVRICPTQALAVKRTDARRLEWRAEACLGCGACANTCPEGCLTKTGEAGIDQLLSPSPVVLYEERPALCRRCGKPLESATFLRTVEVKLLAHGLSREATAYLHYCADCKDEMSFPGVHGQATSQQ